MEFIHRNPAKNKSYGPQRSPEKAVQIKSINTYCAVTYFWQYPNFYSYLFLTIIWKINRDVFFGISPSITRFRHNLCQAAQKIGYFAVQRGMSCCIYSKFVRFSYSLNMHTQETSFKCKRTIYKFYTVCKLLKGLEF